MSQFLFEVEKSEGKLQIILRIRTVSEGNCFEPWRKKHARHKKQREAVHIAMIGQVKDIWLPCTITVSRHAPRLLDPHDNLPMSLKYIVDAIADQLVIGKKAGHADGDPRLTWKYAQEKSKEYFVKISFQF